MHDAAKRSHRDVEWYFRDCAAELGYRSGWNAMVTRALTGWDPSTGGGHNNAAWMPDSVVKAAGRSRRIRAALLRLRPCEFAVLEAFYTPRREVGLARLTRLGAPLVAAEKALERSLAAHELADSLVAIESRPTSAEGARREREAQRRSFAYGNVAMSNARVTRSMVDAAADRMAEASARTETLRARLAEAA